MKQLILIISILFIICPVFGQTVELSKQLDDFYSNYITNDNVAYSLIKEKGQQELNEIIGLIGQTKLDTKATNAGMAYLLNVYNILVINSIVENLPTESPQAIPGFFSKNEHNLGGTKYTLDQIENELIRPIYKDPRVHFALVCGANGCPPISDKAYNGEVLDETLDSRVKQSVNDPDFIQISEDSSSVKVSEIFEWFKDDFQQKNENILEFINSYRDEELPETIKISTYKYDWGLNESEKKN